MISLYTKVRIFAVKIITNLVFEINYNSKDIEINLKKVLL